MKKIDSKTIALSWAYSIALSNDVHDHDTDLRDIFKLLGLYFPFDEQDNCIDASVLEKMGAKSVDELKDYLRKQRLNDLAHKRGYHDGEHDNDNDPLESCEFYMDGYEKGQIEWRRWSSFRDSED